jgi:hypothetical protein
MKSLVTRGTFCIGLITAVFILALTGVVEATLIDIGGGVIQDDRNDTNPYNDQYWFQDLDLLDDDDYSDGISKDYSYQLNFISDMNLPSSLYNNSAWGPWHLADLSEMQSLWSNSAVDIGNVFTPTYYAPTYYDIPIYAGRYAEAYSDTEHYYADAQVAHYPGSPPSGSLTPLQSFYISDAYSYWMSAWITADATQSQVPEPSTLFLLGVGIIGIGGSVRKKLKNEKTKF